MPAVTANKRTACDEVEMFLSPTVDGELLGDDLSRVESHVAECEHCRIRLAQLTQLKKAVAFAGRNAQMPDALLSNIRADIRSENAGPRALRNLVIAASLALVVASVAFFAMRPDAPSPVVANAAAPLLDGRMVKKLVERHRMNLPVDVASPDARRVQDFLASRVGHVVVPHLEGHGFGLEGGRVVDVDQVRGAQLVYSGGYGQRLSVVAVPDPDGNFAQQVVTTSAEGLNVRVVSHQGTAYSFVGDVEDASLQRLASEVR